MPRFESKTLRTLALVTLVGTLSAGCCKKETADPAADADAQYRRELIKQVPMPASVHAEPFVDAPIIQIDGENIRVDGSPAGRFGSDTGTDEVRSLLKGKRELWKMINPGREFPGVVLLAGGRDTPGSKVAAIARAGASEGFPKMGIIVHAVEKGALSPSSLGVVTVEVRVAPASEEPPGVRLMLGPANMAVLYWKSGDGESSQEPVAMTDEPGADGTIRLPGLKAVVGRAIAAHKDEQRNAVVYGLERVPLSKLVGLLDVFRDSKPEFHVLCVVPSR